MIVVCVFKLFYCCVCSIVNTVHDRRRSGPSRGGCRPKDTLVVWHHPRPYTCGAREPSLGAAARDPANLVGSFGITLEAPRHRRRRFSEGRSFVAETQAINTPTGLGCSPGWEALRKPYSPPTIHLHRRSTRVSSVFFSYREASTDPSTTLKMPRVSHTVFLL